MTWRLRLLYGTGQLPEGIKSATFGFFLLFYYNQVLGLSGTLSGAAVFIALCVDAISDPWVGSLSDATRSRWGRRHPYMVAAALPFAAAFVLLLLPPDHLGQWGLFAWLTVFAALTRITMTFYHVPYLAMGAELTQDYDERTLIAALRNVFQLIGMFMVLIGGNMLFFHATDVYANGQLNPEAYAPFALACAPFLVGGVLLAAFGTWSRIPELSQRGKASDNASNTAMGSLRQAFIDLRTAFQIPSFVALVGASVLFGITQGLISALHLYTATYFFELSSGQITLLFAGAIIGIIIGSGLSRPLAALIPEKRTLFIVGTSWYAIWTTSIIIARLMDWVPGNDVSWVAPLYMTTGCISAIGLGATIPMIGSMVADVTDEHERRHGERQEGIFYAAASFAAKAVSGAGPVAAGLIVDLAGISPGSTVSSVDADAIARFGWAQGPSVLFLSALSIACICFYRITRAEHASILAAIRARSA